MDPFIWVCLNIVVAIATGTDCRWEPKHPPLQPPYEEMMVRLTAYDTALCEPGELCVQGDGDGLFASGYPTSNEWYGKMAACPLELYGRTIRVLDMRLFCGDNFGYWNGEPVKTVRYDEDVGWFMLVDIFYPVAALGAPEWTLAISDDWEFTNDTIAEIEAIEMGFMLYKNYLPFVQAGTNE